ncbi:hypothetical protein diail_9270, partial [Diaporthe ilicicola]
MAQQDGPGSRLRSTPCIQSLLGFFFNKGVRGGPKIFLNLAAVLFALLLVIKLMQQRLSDGALNSIPHDLWNGVSKEEDDSTPGGLRLVVFGENELGTPVGQDEEVEGSVTWTEAVCAQLECSKHISMAPSPDSPAWSVSSKALYASGLERVLNETADTNSPGMDYSYLSTYYAPKWQTLDLKDQVDRFLAMPKPRHAPKETLWVFNFGFWDVWSLSALPIPAGKQAADAMTKDIFEQIERLYEASTDSRSIAWSNIKYVSAPASPATSPEAESEEPPVGGPTEKRDEGNAENGSGMETSAAEAAEYFRLLIPQITDPSLLPGWRDLRAQLPEVHSKAEQMRNSAELTEHWNDRIVDGLVEWVKKENKQPGEDDNKESKRTDAETDASSPLAEPPTIQTTQAETVVDSAPAQSRPSPIRDGFAYNLAKYVVDAMVERQLRNARLKDGAGRGGGAVDEGFRDVSNSCVQRVDTALVSVQVQSGVRLEIPNEEIGGDVQVPSATTQQKQQQKQQAERRGTSSDKEGEAKKEAKAAAGEMLPNVTDTVKVCQIPGDYLFYTPFALSQKAIAEIAVQTADMIRNNETIRGKLEAQMGQ